MLNDESMYSASNLSQPSSLTRGQISLFSVAAICFIPLVLHPSGIATADELCRLSANNNYSGLPTEPFISNTKISKTATAPMIQHIQQTLGISTSQCAKVLGVSRQTIYDYRNGQEAGADIFKRIQLINNIANHWKSLQGGALSGKIDLPFSDGATLLELLIKPEIDEQTINKRLEQVARYQRNETDSPFGSRPSILKVLREMGVPEPTETELFLSREEQRIRRFIKQNN